MRTGQNTTETILNTTNVNVNQFGKLFALPTDGQVYAQPLYVPGVTINGVVHNVLIVATENDSVYAYDADSNAGLDSAPLWMANLVDTTHGGVTNEVPMNAASIGCTDLQPQVGVTSTPVIDTNPTSNTIYVEAKSTDGTNYYHRLHALDLFTGHEKSPGPILISATVAGTGDGSLPNGQLAFDSFHEMARPGLLLSNNTIYIAYASHCDLSPFHGWLFAYDEPTLTQKSVYVTTPNGGNGGFWMGGAGVAADSSGNIYIPSGNGDFDAVNVPATETGDTLLKLGTTNQILTLLDYFTPQDQATLDGKDRDLGSGGALLLPSQPGSYPNILVQAGKEGLVYVVDRDQLTSPANSHYCSGCTNDPEIIEESSSGAVGGIFGAPAYWNNNVYFWGAGNELKSIPITTTPGLPNTGLPDFTNIATNTTKLGFPGATPSISSNGTTAGTAILWAIDSSQYGSPGPGPGPAVLYAFDATNVSNQLWNSTQAGSNRDFAGNAVKFAVPTISNGKVYIGTSSEVDVYGLEVATPQILPAAASYSGSVTVTITDAMSGATITYTTDGTTPVPGTNGTTISSGGSFTLTSSATVTAIGSASGYRNSNITAAAYTITAIVPTAATASFVGSDSTTKGSWHAKYGADGYSIGNTPYQSIPSYATFTPNGSLFTWSSGTTDPRALAIPGGSGGVASCWYSAGAFNFNVNITDGNTHQIALYAVDWDSLGRAETITIVDANNPNTVLSTQSISGFSGGVYLVWVISGHVQINITQTGAQNAVISGVFFAPGSNTQTAPLITSANSTTFAVGAPGTFTVAASGYPTPTLSEAGSLPNPVTFNTTTNVLSGMPAAGTNGSYPITFTATNSAGTKTQNFTLTVNVASAGPTASFVGSDSTTKGSWQGKYGADGYSIGNTPYQSLPSYATFTPNGTPYTWNASTTDPRALAIPGGSGGVASCWYKYQTFNFDVNITDGNTHQIALYALDWDSLGRAETITIVDANNPGTVLSTRSIAGFSGGTYLIWTISGHVQIIITQTGPQNAVISGVFFK